MKFINGTAAIDDWGLPERGSGRTCRDVSLVHCMRLTTVATASLLHLETLNARNCHNLQSDCLPCAAQSCGLRPFF